LLRSALPLLSGAEYPFISRDLRSEKIFSFCHMSQDNGLPLTETSFKKSHGKPFLKISEKAFQIFITRDIPTGF
jgi:hypothetical protein